MTRPRRILQSSEGDGREQNVSFEPKRLGVGAFDKQPTNRGLHPSVHITRSSSHGGGDDEAERPHDGGDEPVSYQADDKGRIRRAPERLTFDPESLSDPAARKQLSKRGDPYWQRSAGADAYRKQG